MTMLAPRAATLTFEWRPLAALAELADAWRALAARAAEPNVFYEPAFALAALPAFGQDTGAVLAWSAGRQPELLGVLPARIERNRYGAPFPLLTGWTHPYAPLGVPLIDRDNVATVVAALIDHVAQDPALPDVLLLPLLPADGPIAAALADAVAARGGRIREFSRHQRAVLAPEGDRAFYLELALDRKKRKDLARLRRRLAETGAVQFDLARTPAAIGGALPQFFALEEAGWKGRAGTAAAQDGEVRHFIERAVTGLAADGKAFAAQLCHGDATIAAALTLTSGNAAWFWKIAYDERAARASPGVQITLDLTEALLADPTIARADSCAVAGHPMIDHVWRERLDLADYLVAIGANAARNFALVSSLENLRRTGVNAAKRLRELLRRA
jgi:CelD/BcsL family acetyltransferase involved in cellulose biosynthesis